MVPYLTWNEDQPKDTRFHVRRLTSSRVCAHVAMTDCPSGAFSANPEQCVTLCVDPCIAACTIIATGPSSPPGLSWKSRRL